MAVFGALRLNRERNLSLLGTPAPVRGARREGASGGLRLDAKDIAGLVGAEGSAASEAEVGRGVALLDGPELRGGEAGRPRRALRSPTRSQSLVSPIKGGGGHLVDAPGAPYPKRRIVGLRLFLISCPR